MKKLLLFSVLSFLLLSGCAKSGEDQIADTYQGSPEQFANNQVDMSKFDQTAMPKAGDKIITMETTKGTIKIKLFPELAPKTVENFTGLAEKGYYDGLIFHRVIPDFMIQGGDPTGTGTGGESVWGGKFANEISPYLKNLRGALSMANAGPNTNGSQFFIVQKEDGASWLDGQYNVFGQVYEGMDVVDAIANVKRDANDKPLEDIKMDKVTVGTY